MKSCSMQPFHFVDLYCIHLFLSAESLGPVYMYHEVSLTNQTGWLNITIDNFKTPLISGDTITTILPKSWSLNSFGNNTNCTIRHGADGVVTNYTLAAENKLTVMTAESIEANDGLPTILHCTHVLCPIHPHGDYYDIVVETKNPANETLDNTTAAVLRFVSSNVQILYSSCCVSICLICVIEKGLRTVSSSHAFSGFISSYGPNTLKCSQCMQSICSHHLSPILFCTLIFILSLSSCAHE